MLKEQFIKYMNTLVDKHQQLEIMYDAFAEITGSVPDRLIETTDIQFAIDMLADCVSDTDGWIGWFINEKECGTRDELIIEGKNGNVLPSETVEDIWNLIMMDRESE